MSSCDLSSILKRDFNMLIDIFKLDLKKNGVESVYTKCLYTAVTILFLICGQNAIEGSLKCYVDTVKDRMKRITDKAGFIFKSVKEAEEKIMRKDGKRMVYFVMITNSELPYEGPGESRPDEFFPGHVFVIDKQLKRGENLPCYKIYQSYINKYTLQDYSRKKRDIILENNNNNNNNNSSEKRLYMEYDYERMTKLMKQLSRFMNSKTWDQQNCNFWKEFTLVDANNFLGYPVQPYINFCYNELPALHCKKGLFNLLDEKRSKGLIPDKYKDRVNKLLASYDKNNSKKNNNNNNNGNIKNEKDKENRETGILIKNIRNSSNTNTNTNTNTNSKNKKEK